MTLTPAQKKYHAIKNSLTVAQKELIKFYELQWMLRNRVPTVEEVTQYLRQKRPNIRQTSVNYYLMQPQVIKALKARGIPFEQHTQSELTGQQQAAALTVANFVDKRSVKDKLDELGILPATYYAWLNDPNYRNFVQSLADRNLDNVDPIAKTEFVKKVQDGEAWAIKFYMENTGVLKNNDTPQSEIIIMKLIEIMQKHIKNPVLLNAIANDMIAAFSNKSLSPSVAENSLPGEFKELGEFAETDPELEAAKKQLGFG